MKVGLQSIKTVALILLLASMTLLMTGCMETGTYEEGYASKYMSGWSSGIWTLYIDNLDDDDGDIERAEAFNLTVRYMTLNATPDNITFGNITPGYSGNITLNITNIGDWTQEDVTINASAGSCSNYFGDSDSELLCINSLGISTLPLWEYAHLDDVLDSYSGGIDLRNKSSGSLYVYAKNLFDPFFNLTVYIVPTEAPGKTYSIDNFTSTITLDESLYNLHLPGGEGYNIFINSDSPNTTVLVYYFAYQQLATTSIDSLGDMSAGETEELTLQLDVPEENLSYFTSSEGNIILSSTNGGYLGIPFNFTLNMPYLYSSLSYINNIVLSPGESTTAGFMIENLGSLNVTQWNVTCAGDSCDLLDIEIHNGSDIIYVNGSVQYAIFPFLQVKH